MDEHEVRARRMGLPPFERVSFISSVLASYGCAWLRRPASTNLPIRLLRSGGQTCLAHANDATPILDTLWVMISNLQTWSPISDRRTRLAVTRCLRLRKTVA